MEYIMGGLLVAGIVLALFLFRRQHALQKEISMLRQVNKEKEEEIETLKRSREEWQQVPDLLDTHDKVVELSESGESVENISKQLQIPESKVIMTLKFEKMKHHGAH